MYSGHKKKHAMGFLVVTDLCGRFRYIWGPTIGRLNDRQRFMMSPLYAESHKFFPHLTIDGQLRTCVVLGDGAFAGDGPVMVPFKKTMLDQSTASTEVKNGRRAYNRALRYMRSVVENAFSFAKGKFRIIKHPMQACHQHTMELVVPALFGAVAYMQQRGHAVARRERYPEEMASLWASYGPIDLTFSNVLYETAVAYSNYPLPLPSA